MGLDTVEMVMSVEEHFGIEIPDEVAGTLETPGKLKAFVLERVGEGRHGCLSQRAFYRLRRAAREVSGSPAAVGPGTSWESILPSATARRKAWKAIQQTSGLRLPPLVRAGWIPRSVALVALCVCAGSFFLASDAERGFALALLSLVVASIAGTYLTRPMATRFLPCFATVGETAEMIASWDNSKLLLQGEGWSKTEVSTVVDFLIEEQSGVPRWEFNDESHFVRDLGLD